ncbi:MAG: flagellar motor protein [Burkholderiales bacterium]|nr:flagellar motor protein [Burkholderiales bacterium]
MRFDFNSAIGLLLALAGIVGGHLLEGGHLDSLLQVTAFVIVAGGTMGAVMLQTPINVFWGGIKMLKWIFIPPSYVSEALIRQITAWSSAVRKDGLLVLDNGMEAISDPFARRGVQLLVDGVPPDKLRDMLEVEINAFEDFGRQGAKVWEAAGGYAPTIGILGAVLGLIHVMENLSNPGKLGGGIAVAFVATIYGVGLANLIFLPIASKLKTLINQQVVWREMLIDGLVAISEGENPRIIEEKLLGYVV